MKLVLASSSKNRKDLFDMLGLKYQIIKSNIEERSTSLDPKQYVTDLSHDKIENVSKQLSEKALIVACDSIMYVDNKILEKPKTKEEAFNNMKFISGKKVLAITAITIKDMYQDKTISKVDITEIYFDEIKNDEITWYINDNNILNCCGFSLEGRASVFINRIVGDYNTVRGISVNKLYSIIKELGYSISDFQE